MLHVNGSGCAKSGASVRCSATGVVSMLLRGGTKNDELTNATNLPGVLRGNKGDDRLQGESGRDTLDGDQGNDHEFGGGGNDDLAHEPGADVLNGQDGTADRVSYATAPSAASIQLDENFATVGSEKDTLASIERAIGTPFSDKIDGTNVNNTLSRLAGADIIRGFGANDVMDGGDGADSLDGDGGIDAVDYRARTSGVIVRINDVADDGNSLDGPAGARDNVSSETENVRGGKGSDTLRGQQGAPTVNRLEGNEGSDVLDGGPGPDVLSGAAGVDRVDYAARGAEDINVSLDSLTANDGGGASDDSSGKRDDVFGVENVTTAAGDDILEGNGSANVLDTGAGDDQLFGEGGNDTLKSGPGIDRIEGGRDADTLETTDGEADQPLSCGEGSSSSPNIDPEDKIDGDVADLLANPLIAVPGDPAECELRVFH